MIRSVAVIGVGSMGAVMARRLQEAGFALTVCDVDEAVLARFAQDGARIARTPAECASADLVLVLVATPEQVRAVVLGEQGLQAGSPGPGPGTGPGMVPGMVPGAGPGPIVAVMSTVPVATIHALRQGLAAGVGLLDAPFSGGLGRAESGTLSVMAGGDPTLLDAIRPVLRTFAADIFHCGGLGAGQAVKIVNNIVGNANAFFTAEAYRLATELGLDIAGTARVLESSTGRNFFSADPAGLPATFAAMVRNRGSFDALLGIMRKDIGFAAQLAEDAPGQYPAIAALQALLEHAGGETYDNWRHIAGAAARPDDAAPAGGVS